MLSCAVFILACFTQNGKWKIETRPRKEDEQLKPYCSIQYTDGYIASAERTHTHMYKYVCDLLLLLLLILHGCCYYASNLQLHERRSICEEKEKTHNAQAQAHTHTNTNTVSTLMVFERTSHKHMNGVTASDEQTFRTIRIRYKIYVFITRVKENFRWLV